jgi:hypothetical protein
MPRPATSPTFQPQELRRINFLNAAERCAADRYGRRQTNSLHLFGVRVAKHSQQLCSWQEEQVVKVGYRVIFQTGPRSQRNLGRYATDRRCDRRADDRMEMAPHWIPSHDQDRALLLANYVGEPNLTSGWLRLFHDVP